MLERNSIRYTETTDLSAVMPELDVLYMTRVQKERFFNEEDYLRLKDSYILRPEKLADAKSDLSVLHPLPRVNEISVAVDSDSRACYFKQVENGKLNAHGADNDASGGNVMNIDPIKNGIVIDHITAGSAMKIYSLLRLGTLTCPVALICNVQSRRMVRKDIIKIDSEFDIDLNLLGYVDPGATVNIIRNGIICEKKRVGCRKGLLM